MSEAPGRFELVSDFEPQGDQPRAIEELSESIAAGAPHQTLLGVTGSGKSFTMACVVARLNRPTLVMAPNKTLAAQLYAEFKQLFPRNAVCYFVSYYDYYQPEAYLPATDTYIEKDASINDEIDKLRHEATQSLLTRRDVLVVASVSCIYGLGAPSAYGSLRLYVEAGQRIRRDDLLRRLVDMLYTRNDLDFHRGTFRVRGDVVEVFPQYESERALRIEFFGDEVEGLAEVDPLRGKVVSRPKRAVIYPASHYVATEDVLARAADGIRGELQGRLQELRSANKLLEAQRLEQRVQYDLEMLQEMGFCHGVENYSRWLDGRAPGQAPYTLHDYFPEDRLVFLDESHVTVPQIGGMYRGDRARKETLVEYGFRLPSALDNRPLRFEEWLERVPQAVYVSATPADYELERSKGVVVEQIIRPTGLTDPKVEVRRATGQVDDLLGEIRARVAASERVLVTTLTKRMAEELTDYYGDHGVRVRYLHSDIATIERTEIIRELREGAFDVLVGINLLREGLDIPEVALVAILDADKEGFLRSTRSLIQTIGRAARNVNGTVILYADQETDSIRATLAETNRRRTLQERYNAEHGITPRSVVKRIASLRDSIWEADYVTVPKRNERRVQSVPLEEIDARIAELRAEMAAAAAALEFERAAALRDEVRALETERLAATYVDLAEKIEALPAEPGVYLFKNERGKVLYVGKAQNLRSRVRSYFAAGGDGRPQVPHLVERARDVEVLVLPTVKDALLLENELIKRHKPAFNVRLRDDKQYLALRLDPRETWPRLTLVRRFGDDGAGYFGPYTSSGAMHESLANLRKLFPLRSCRDGVFRDHQRRGRPCIEYEMKRCAGPCVGLVSTEEYASLVHGTTLFLRGRSQELRDELRGSMQRAAAEERFEDAGRLRDRIEAVERTVERQQVVSERPVSRDVFALAREGGEVELQALAVRDGRLIGNASHSFSDVALDDGALLASFLGQYYGSGAADLPGEVLTPAPIEDEGALEALLRERAGRAVHLHAPQRGAGRELVELAETNARLALGRRLGARASVDAALSELQERLGLSRLPRRIECYDVSTLSGSLAVGSRVVFEDGRPRKGDYRRYRIRQAAGGDDYDCLREVMRRRLDKVEAEPLPDLLLVDGGKGQLAIVSAALFDRGLSVDAAGIAKERDEGSPTLRVRRSGGLKAERVFLPARKDAVLLPPDSRGLLLLQRVRDEAHRFAIEFQRALRNRAGLTSVLEEIPGIGPGKRRALLRELGSLRAVREAGVERLGQVTGLTSRDAETIRGFFDGLAGEGGPALAEAGEGSPLPKEASDLRPDAAGPARDESDSEPAS